MGAELVREVVAAVSERQDRLIRAIEAETGGLDEHLANLRESWRLALGERSIQLQRLDIEAAMLQPRDLRADRVSLTSFHRWVRTGSDALRRMGIASAVAELEARVIVVSLYGLHYDLIITRDVARATAAFQRVHDDYARRIQRLFPA